MAWFTEQILADFLNKCEDFEVVKNELSNILADDVVLYFGKREYRSKSAVRLKLAKQKIRHSKQAITSE